jgi:hypothetical protein
MSGGIPVKAARRGFFESGAIARNARRAGEKSAAARSPSALTGRGQGPPKKSETSALEGPPIGRQSRRSRQGWLRGFAETLGAPVRLATREPSELQPGPSVTGGDAQMKSLCF